jgi:hypothetical protein
MIGIILGVPGAGKTTMLTQIAKKAQKKNIPVFSNCYIDGAYIINAKEDLGKYMIENSVIIIDEGGSEFSNRDWKQLCKRVVRFFKMHRHYKCDVYLSSQDYDIDIKIRNLCSKIWVVRKSLIPYFISVRTILSRIDINENKKTGERATDIIKTFAYKPMMLGGRQHIFAPKYWKYFNSYYTDKLMTKEWKQWTREDEKYYTYDFTKPEVLKEFEK